ncbi:MAG: sugar ABC transporter ATP-binding protein [Deltaproteobacteria bacterium]|nr:sugar ABC transporter ATP-binding protein [Deltaproteobacteria bacterium]
MASTSDNGVLLETRGLTKRYPGVLALDGVDFTLKAGEVHVLFGENGAGKSTLISILAGVQLPTSGEVRFAGAPVTLDSVRAARKLGISAVFQEFSLVPTLTVAQNLFLGDEPRRHGFLDRAAMKRGARQLLGQLDFPIDPNATVAFLPRAEQQMVEIAKAFRSELSVLILDEPTASLTERETRRLFALVEKFKAAGVAIVYISHRMQEIRRIGDRVTVLRDGRRIGTVDARSTDEDRLIEMMTGRPITEIYPPITWSPGEPLLEIRDLTTAGGEVRGASMQVRRHEVVGIAGLVGSGKSELMRAAFGLLRAQSGSVHFRGREMTNARPRQLLEAGMFYLPPDRKEEGLILSHSSNANMSLPALRRYPLRRALGLLSNMARNQLSEATARKVQLAFKNLGRPVAHLSGGNQQKVLFAKGLVHEVDLFVYDEPTVGVDMGTRSALYALVKELCETSSGVVVVSSDLPEILHLCHRVYVMRRGRLVAELQGEAIRESNVLQHFFGEDRTA